MSEPLPELPTNDRFAAIVETLRQGEVEDSEGTPYPTVEELRGEE